MISSDHISYRGLTTTLPGIKQAYSVLPQYVSIQKNFVMPTFSNATKKARVVHPFYIKVEQLEKEYIVSSEISDVFETYDILKEAILAYLRSLVDELIWLEEHKSNLSNHMLKDLKKLQFYLTLL